MPQRGQRAPLYDLVLASQPYRARLPADVKVRTVLAPLASSLAPGGRMLTIQSTGKDPGMEIIRAIWPDENPFQTSRQLLLRELRTQLRSSQPDLRYHPYSDQRSEFSYSMHMQPMEITHTMH